MNIASHTVRHTLLAVALLILWAPSAFADLTSLSDHELRRITGQSGLQTFINDGLTEEQRREEEKKNSQIQAMMALNGLVPTELIRDAQNIRNTINSSAQIVRQFNTMQEDLLIVPTVVNTIISLPPMGLTGGGGFFF